MLFWYLTNNVAPLGTGYIDYIDYRTVIVYATSNESSRCYASRSFAAGVFVARQSTTVRHACF